MVKMGKLVTVKNPVVEMDGDEMARVIWHMIREKLILPHLDINIRYFDLSIQNRDATENKVTAEAAQAIKECGVGIKCATITADAARVKEFNLKQMWKSPNATLRAAMNGSIVREPIVIPNIPATMKSWTKQIVVARHGFGDQYAATEMRIERPGTLQLVFTDTKGCVETRDVQTFNGPAVTLAMYNTDDSVSRFAHICFRTGLEKKLPVILSTKNTILQIYDGLFKDMFQRVFDSEYRTRFEAAGLWYEHKLIDDMVAFVVKSDGGFLWAAKNYDGDVESDMVAQGFGSLGLMTSELKTSDDAMYESEAAHGTVTRHYREHQKGNETSTNSVASIFAWTRGLMQRAKVDGDSRLKAFCEALEKAVVDTIGVDGTMTKDLALLLYGKATQRKHYVNTEQFIDAVAVRLEKATAEIARA